MREAVGRKWLEVVAEKVRIEGASVLILKNPASDPVEDFFNFERWSLLLFAFISLAESEIRKGCVGGKFNAESYTCT